VKIKKYSEFSNLKMLMKRRKCSYKKLSDEIGISIDAINNKLNGYTALNIDEAKRISCILKIHPSEFNRYFTGL
jgi:transcriptional regulator with XRE-family HTH domain